MSYLTLLTAVGEQKLAAALANKTPLTLTHMAIGDGGGTLPIPSHNQTQLVNETYRAPLNRLTVDPDKTHQLLAEMIIPAEIGGMWTRELGLIDSDGDLFAVGNFPETYKPSRAEGAISHLILHMLITSSHTECVTLLDDPSAVIATAESVNNAIEKLHEKYVPLTRTVNKKALTTDITLTAADVGTDTTAQINSKVAAAKKAGTDAQLTANSAATAADNANTNANGRVPNSRTINGKSLLTDLILTAADLGITIPKNTALLDTNGWWKCGDTGWIIQWGIVPAGASNTLNHPLPTQFPNKGLWALGQSYWAMPYDEDKASGSAQLLSTAPNTTIRVTTDNGVPTAWIAIGY